MARQSGGDADAKRSENRPQEKPAASPRGAGVPKGAAPRAANLPPPAAAANDGPTGAEEAARLNVQAANYRAERDDHLARVEAADEDMAMLREEIVRGFYGGKPHA